MIYSQRASLVHPGEELRGAWNGNGKGKSAVGQFLDRMRQSSYRVGEGSRSRNDGGAPEEGSGNTGVVGDRVVAGSGSEAGRFGHPQRRTGRESVAGDEIKEKVWVAVGNSDVR